MADESNGKLLEHRLTALEQGQAQTNKELARMNSLLERAIEQGSSDRRQLNERITRLEERMTTVNRIVWGAVGVIGIDVAALIWVAISNGGS